MARERTTSATAAFSRLLRDYLQHAGARAWALAGLLFALGATEGVGIAMLLPFLHVVGLTESGRTNRVVEAVRSALESCGLPLTLPVILCVYVGVVALQALAARQQSVLGASLTQGFVQRLRDRLFAALVRAEWLCVLRLRGADVTQVLASDLNRVGSAAQQTLTLVGAATVAVIQIGAAFLISPPMTLVALGCGAALVLCLRPVDLRARRLGEAVRGKQNALFRVTGEFLAGMKPAKSYGRESAHAEAFAEATGGIMEQRLRFSRLMGTAQLVHKVGAVAALSVFFYVAVAVAKLPVGSMLLLVYLFARLLPRIAAMHRHWQNLLNALPSYEAAEALRRDLDEAREPEAPDTSERTPLPMTREARLENVSFRYDAADDAWALRAVDVAIPQPGTVAIVGPSGGGKSTLADVLMGLMPPAEGRIVIDGAPLDTADVRRWRRSVGYVPQESFLFHDTIRANLLWTNPDADEAALWDALRAAAAEDFVRALPKALDTVVGERGVRLSGGERQRIALARALLCKPALLLLDEATSSLDAENERRIQGALDRLGHEMAVVVIAHRVSTIRNANEIIVLDGGRVIERGTWSDLTASNGRFSRLLQAAEVDGAPMPGDPTTR